MLYELRSSSKQNCRLVSGSGKARYWLAIGKNINAKNWVVLILLCPHMHVYPLKLLQKAMAKSCPMFVLSCIRDKLSAKKHG